LSATLLLAWWWRSSSHDGNLSQIEPTPLANSEIQDKRLPPPNTGNGNHPKSGDQPVNETRSDSASIQLLARVVDEESNGIEGVTISWTSLLPLPLGRLREWGTIDWHAIDAATVTCTSDPRGNFNFAVAPSEADSVGSVLWLTHPDFEALPVLVDARADAWKTVTLCRLKRLQCATVQVTDADNKPVDGARVEQCALLPDSSSNVDERTLRAYRMFHRVWTTDPTGKLRAGVVDGQQGWWASKGQFLTKPVFSKSPSGSDVNLILRPSFELHGRVRLADGKPDGTPIRLRADIDGDEGPAALDQLVVTDSLEFGPRKIPTVEGALYHFRLDGGGLVSCEVTRPAPAAGEEVEIELATSAAGAIAVRVVDTEQAKVFGATVTVSFQLEHAWRQVYETTGDDGVARISGVVGGSILLDVIARSFAAQRFGPFTVAADGTDEVISVELHRAGILRGTCMHAGEPVRDFAVTLWGADRTKPITRQFSNRRDGRFELEDAALGEAHVLAFSDKHAHSTVVDTQVTVSQPSEVTLDLPDGLRAVGRVIDAGTLEPLAAARVQLWVVNGSIGLAEQGPPVAAANDGRFELSNVAPGLVRFHVTAPGYASVTPTSTATVGQTLDFGVLALTRRGSFDVRLVGDKSTDLTGFTCSLSGFEAYPDVEFNALGIAHFENIAAGPWEVTAKGPNDFSRLVRTVLAAGHPWVLDMPIASDRRIDVRIVPAAGEGLPDKLGVECLFRGNANERVSDWRDVDESGRTTLDHIARDRVYLEVSSGDVVIATTRVDLVAGDNHVDIHLDGRRQSIRVVDRAHQPMPATMVTLVDPTFAECMRISERAGPDGVASFAHLPFERGIAVLEHASLGTHLDVPVDLSNAEREAVEVMFDPSATMRAALVDGAAAVSGAGVRISDRTRLYVLADTATDEHGQVTYGPVSAGEMMIDVIDPRVWREQFSVHSTQDEHVTTVQVRRLGGVELTARNASGVLMRDVGVALYCSDLKTDVATWIADGRVGGAPQQLVTDASGKLHVNGLPRGNYRWSIGETASGSFEIVGGSVAHVDALVP
jgi:hypothetical protein